MIEVRNLNKSFGNFKSLDNLSLNVKKGSVYGLVGPNGAGKTTLFKIITGESTYDSGEQVTGARIASSVNSRGNDAYLVVLENQIVIFYGIIRRSLIKNTGDDDRLDLRFFQRSGNPGNPVQIIRFVLILGKPYKIRVC